MAQAKSLIFETAFSIFTSVGVIGEGGAGRVFRVTDEDGGVFAIKMLDPGKANREKRKRFQNELHFCLKTKHPNIIQVLDHGILRLDRSSAAFYVMPFYSGSLRTLIKGGISPGKVLGYFSQLLDGVEAAHILKVFHRDLKPENVLYDNRTDRLVIADFGIASFGEEELYTLVATSPQARLANFQYAAPEQRSRGAVVDHRADIYALGLILNEMFTGEIPHGTGYKTISATAPELVYCDDLVSIMLRQSPAERPASIDVIKQQLIARKNEFITRQRLSALKETVIPVTDIDDPLVLDPPRLVNVDWDKGVLALFFQRPVDSKWVEALWNMGSYTSAMGKDPNRFKFNKERATIDAQEHEVQGIINHFKDWLPQAQRVYENMLRREKREAEEKQRARLKADIEQQEQRQRVLSSIKL